MRGRVDGKAVLGSHRQDVASVKTGEAISHRRPARPLNLNDSGRVNRWPCVFKRERDCTAGAGVTYRGDIGDHTCGLRDGQEARGLTLYQT